MQASVLFSLAVSTDFTVATGREEKKNGAHVPKDAPRKALSPAGGTTGTGKISQVQKIEQAERHRRSSLSNTVMGKNGASG